MLPQQLITKKRDGLLLDAADFQYFADGVKSGDISDAQISAVCMATFYRDFEISECVEYTRALIQSGQIVNWDDLPGPTADKHSTGGVGDLVSIILAPLVASCGVYVPMVSGRGLGHTGGTLDKLESIPGVRTTIDVPEFKLIVRSTGWAIVGQSPDIVPAEGRVYSVRDTTATVDVMGLIVGSIISKKVASGTSNLVMDVKTGNGAVTTSERLSKKLAETLELVGNLLGVRTKSILTEMSEPLVSSVGNSVEIQFAIRCMKEGRLPTRLARVVDALGSEMLIMAGVAADQAEASTKISTALSGGYAFETFSKTINMMGAPIGFSESPAKYQPIAPVSVGVHTQLGGRVSHIDCRAIGWAAVELGAGRRHPKDEIRYDVGITDLVECNEVVREGQRIATVHASDGSSADRACIQIQNSIQVSDD